MKEKKEKLHPAIQKYFDERLLDMVNEENIIRQKMKKEKGRELTKEEEMKIPLIATFLKYGVFKEKK